MFFCRIVFVIIFGASGPGVRSIQKIAQWDIDFSCVFIAKESQPCDQSAVSEGRPPELLQERSDTYPGRADTRCTRIYEDETLVLRRNARSNGSPRHNKSTLK